MAARGRLQQPSRRRQAVVSALALFLILILLVLPGGWQAALLLLLLLAPVLGFFAWVFQQQHHHGVTDQELKQVALCFAAGVFPAPMLAMLAQSLLLPLWTLLCFFDQRASLQAQLQTYWDASGSSSSSSSFSADDEEAYDGSSSSSSTGVSPPPHASRLADVLLQLDVEKTFGYYVFLFALAFCVAALVEEWLKLWIVQGACCGSCCSKGVGSKRGGLCHPSRLLFQHQRHSSHAFVVFMAVMAGALGFSVFENTGYAFGAGGFRDRLLAAVLRGCVSTPLHCICGGITGVRLAGRLQRRRRMVGNENASEKKPTTADDLARWRTKLAILAPSVALHGLFDFQVLLVASLVTEEMEAAHPIAYGVVAPSAGTLAILVGGFVYLRRALHAMEHQMNAGRYIQVAVDLESGRRVGFSDSDDDDEPFDSDDDFSVQEREFGRGGSPRKTRSVFNV